MGDVGAALKHCTGEEAQSKDNINIIDMKK